MTEIFLALAALACPLGMGAMMWFMMRGTKRSGGQKTQTGDPAPESELQLLRNEVDQLRASQKTLTPTERSGL